MIILQLCLPNEQDGTLIFAKLSKIEILKITGMRIDPFLLQNFREKDWYKFASTGFSIKRNNGCIDANLQKHLTHKNFSNMVQPIYQHLACKLGVNNQKGKHETMRNKSLIY